MTTQGPHRCRPPGGRTARRCRSFAHISTPTRPPRSTKPSPPANIEPLIATGRQPHHPSWRERFAAPPPAPENPTPVEAMAWRLRTPQGKQLYGLRKQTPEPVFGIIKSVMGFRQFLLRGLDCVRGEWSLVTMAWNIKRMHALSLG